MALRDTWHRALVYFGLAEDHDYGPEYEEDFEPETGTEEAYEGGRDRGEGRSSSVRRLPTSRRPPGPPGHPPQLQRRPAGRRPVQTLGPGDPQPADRRPRALEADDRLLLGTDVRVGRRDAADRREDVPFDAA